MCGGAIDGEARFCDGCKKQMTQPANASGPSAPRSLGSRVGELLAWVGLIGLIAAIAIPMFARDAPPQSDLGTTVIGLMILAYVIARLRRAQRAWLYPLAALALVFLIFFAAGAMRGVQDA
jgi:predicted membrane protein